ncbi:MAG: methyltransferase, partial [Verrucomicrobiia bacterium]
KPAVSLDPRYSGLAAELREAMPFNQEVLKLVSLVLARCGVDVKRFLEIGCGDAILAQIVLKTFPKATGVLLDVDEPSLTTAWERLGDESSRMAFVAQDVTDSQWSEAVSNVAPFDVIISSFVLDQQNDEHKVDVYADIFELLGPGGIFLNLDYVSISAPFARKVHDELYIESLAAFRAQKGGSGDRATAERDYLARPDKDYLLPSQTDVQCEWLREIGFVGVDCFFRSLGIALFGGAKPLKVISSSSE